MNKINSRYLAYKILLAVEKEDEYINDALNRFLKKHRVSNRDERLVRKIVFGYLENKMLLNYYIKEISKMPFSKIDLEIKLVIAIGIYQLLFLDKVPSSAAVNESVKVAKKVNYKTKGFVNGVLRNFLRKKDHIQIKSKSVAEELSIKYSYPIWIIKYFLDIYGEEETIELLKFNKKPAAMVVRTNTLRITRKELINRLSEAGVNAKESSLTETGVIVKAVDGLLESDLFNKGYFYVQDDASILVGEILNPKEGERVIDVCAAPGGKTTHIAQLMKDTGEVIGRDVSRSKINLIEENIRRLGIRSITTEVHDATQRDEKNNGKFDKVLVDAPCSGLGLIRKKPDIKYNRSLKDLQQLSSIQYKILEASSKLLKDGGELVYSTCTLGPKENLEVIEKFLYNNKGFKKISIRGQETLELVPHRSHTDGFFICKLKKG